MTIPTHIGRPKISDEQLQDWVSKLELPIKQGQSLKLACLEAQIPFKSAYRKYAEVEWFRHQIDRFKIFKGVICRDIMFQRLIDIHEKYVGRGEELTNKDWKFLMWLAVHDNSLAEDYGNKRIKMKNSDISIPLSETSDTEELIKSLQNILNPLEENQEVKLDLQDSMSEQEENSRRLEILKYPIIKAEELPTLKTYIV